MSQCLTFFTNFTRMKIIDSCQVEISRCLKTIIIMVWCYWLPLQNIAKLVSHACGITLFVRFLLDTWINFVCILH